MKHFNRCFAVLVLYTGMVYPLRLPESDLLIKQPETLPLWIETVRIDMVKNAATIDIMFDAPGFPIAGADLKIGYDSYSIDIVKITRGELPDYCKWEMFDTKVSIDQGKEGYPRSIAQIVTLAEIVADSANRKCKSFDRPVSIARLEITFDKTDAPKLTDTLLPVYFFWEDCTDNTITNESGNSLYMSLVVDGVASVKSINADTDKLIPPGTTPAGAITFPSRYGAPDLCIKPKALNKPVRKLVFKSGGVLIKSVVENEAAGK